MRSPFRLVWLWLALPTLALASSSTALKRYESGKYESALREYKRLLMEKPDDSRLHFNAGAAAFQVNDFDEAAKQLNSALVTQDLQLQERAYYNLGNTEYRLGTEAPAPEKKQANWEHSIGSYESALKLNPNDQDAKFNLELVKKKLEELQKQQQQKQDQSKDQQSKDDQKDQSKKDDQNKQDKDKQQEQKKSDEQTKPDQKKEDQKPEQDPAQKKQDASKDEKKQEEAKQGKESKENNSEKPEDQQGQARRGMIAQMTPEQAQQLLDAQKIDEKPLIFIPKVIKTNRTDRVFKDW